MKDAQRHRVLIADDCRTNQILLDKILEKSGFSTVKVGTGEAVLDLLCNGERFDAVLMDVCMPERDGIETIKFIRFTEAAAGDSASIPIIAMTADGDDEVKRACLRVGADEFVVHPVNYVQLVHAIRRLIREQQMISDSKLGNVVSLMSHKVMRPPVVDIAAVEEILQQTDKKFLLEMSESIKADCEVALNFMQACVASDDINGFHEQIMNIRSSTGSLNAPGIQRIFKACKAITQGRLKTTGPVVITCLQLEAAAIVKALRQYSMNGTGVIAQAV